MRRTEFRRKQIDARRASHRKSTRSQRYLFMNSFTIKSNLNILSALKEEIKGRHSREQSEIYGGKGGRCTQFLQRRFPRSYLTGFQMLHAHTYTFQAIRLLQGLGLLFKVRVKRRVDKGITKCVIQGCKLPA